MATLASLQTQVNGLLATVATLQGQISSLQQRVTRDEQAILQLKTQLSAVKKG